jgi:hypothetical protein
LKLNLLNTSVVILAEAHNPTILHPTFLSGQKIVPPEWELAESPLCTPAIAVARYKNEVVFMAEIGKFQIVDTQPRRDPPIAQLAAKYIEALPHVHYVAVGINFAGFAENDTPAHWLQERFFKSGPWSTQYEAEAAGLKFAYPADQAMLTIDAGTVQQDPKQSAQACILFNCNYHSSLSKDNAVGDAKRVLELFPQRLKHFEAICDLMLKE